MAGNMTYKFIWRLLLSWPLTLITSRYLSSGNEKNNITYLKTGTIEQPVLGRKGDDVRIDWGYFYLAAGTDANTTMTMGQYHATKQDFAANGKLPVNTTAEGLSSDMQNERAYWPTATTWSRILSRQQLA